MREKKANVQKRCAKHVRKKVTYEEITVSVQVRHQNLQTQMVRCEQKKEKRLLVFANTLIICFSLYVCDTDLETFCLPNQKNKNVVLFSRTKVLWGIQQRGRKFQCFVVLSTIKKQKLQTPRKMTSKTYHFGLSA